MNELKRTIILFVLAVCIINISAAKGCTIFVLTDPNNALFCNNEDWSDPNTRIWFVPSGDGYYGCAYVGFDDGYGQGGVNTKGLAYDGVAGYREIWERDPNMLDVQGYPNERMLESCATVEEAIAFYHKYWSPSFAGAKFLIADRSGASAIIGAKDGKLHVEKTNASQGFGFADKVLNETLPKEPAATIGNCADILKRSCQPGKYPTQYSNIFDLKSGDIFLYRFSKQSEAVTLNLKAELKKGGHYYDIPKIDEQLKQEPMGLLDNMERFFVNGVEAVTD